MNPNFQPTQSSSSAPAYVGLRLHVSFFSLSLVLLFFSFPTRMVPPCEPAFFLCLPEDSRCVSVSLVNVAHLFLCISFQAAKSRPLKLQSQRSQGETMVYLYSIFMIFLMEMHSAVVQQRQKMTRGGWSCHSLLFFL